MSDMCERTISGRNRVVFKRTLTGVLYCERQRMSIVNGDFCLAGGTLVDTVYGPMPVEEVPVGTGVFTVTADKIPVVKTVTGHITAGTLPAWEITLDTDETIICSGAHRWLSFHGLFVKTKDLHTGFRMMPSRKTIHPQGYVHRYADCMHRYKKEHRLVAAWKYGEAAIKGKDIHHRDEIEGNNHPDNLEVKDRSRHMGHHSLKRWHQSSDAEKNTKLDQLNTGYQNALATGLNFKGKNNPRYGEMSGELIYCIVCNRRKYKYPTQLKQGASLYCSRKCYFQAKVSGNHKVKEIKELGYAVPMYCLQVADEHTFSLTCGVVSGNSQGEL